jgi:Cys-rich repeat protein
MRPRLIVLASSTLLALTLLACSNDDANVGDGSGALSQAGAGGAAGGSATPAGSGGISQGGAGGDSTTPAGFGGISQGGAGGDSTTPAGFGGISQGGAGGDSTTPAGSGGVSQAGTGNSAGKPAAVCGSNADCPAGGICEAGVCNSVAAGGAGQGGAAQACSTDTDCPAGDVCKGGQCTAGGQGNSCASLDTACAQGEKPGEFGVACASAGTWADALADHHYCNTTITESTEACGSYDARVATNVDFSYIYYYDKATGKLAAIYRDSLGGGVECVGGLPGFVLPTCSAPEPLDPCGSGSGGAGGAGAGGSGGAAQGCSMGTDCSPGQVCVGGVCK